MDIKAVIFDLDGVIVSTDNLHYKAWKAVADSEGIYFDERINNRLRGVSRMESLEIILERASKTYGDEEKLLFAEKKNQIYVELLKSLTSANILQNVEITLKQLKNNGIKIAIGSSSKNTKLILRRIGLDNTFDAIADGNEIKRSKPFPDVFLTAAGKLGINPEYCLVVEDAEAGIKAAKAAGMTAVAIGDAVKSSEADYRLDAIDELLHLFLLKKH
jgi:beta-phosphoglucomutase